MPKNRDTSVSKPLPEGRDFAKPPPEQAKVERAIGVILDQLKPETPARRLDRKTGRTGSQS